MLYAFPPGSGLPRESGDDSKLPLNPKLPLSCYIRTMNSARRLAEVLAPVADLCEQIVIVDSGSTDETIAIAESFGATVIRQPWLGNGHQKRIGEDACRNDWLLDLDSDEVLTPQAVAGIRAALGTDGTAGTSDVYSLPLTIVDPGDGIWYRAGIDWRNKLYRKSVIRQPASGAWDQLDLPESITPVPIDGALLHYVFADSFDMTAKLNKSTNNRTRQIKLRSLASTRLRIFTAFPWYFFKKYVLHGYWKRGTYGFVFAAGLAHSRWLRDVKMYERILKYGQWEEPAAGCTGPHTPTLAKSA